MLVESVPMLRRMFCPQSLVVLVVGSLALLQAAREPELPLTLIHISEPTRPY